jgi:hypothetical protein
LISTLFAPTTWLTACTYCLASSCFACSMQLSCVAASVHPLHATTPDASSSLLLELFGSLLLVSHYISL